MQSSDKLSLYGIIMYDSDIMDLELRLGDPKDQRMDTIECMRAFVAVATNGSFTAAARRTGVSTNLVSKYVRQLEDRLGTLLFTRTTRSVTLTDTGRACVERCVTLLDQLDEMENVVLERQTKLAGLIRVTAPTGFGSTELVQALEPFQRAHPNLTIQMHLADYNVSIVDEGFDLAVRFGGLKDSSLIARKLLDMRRVVVASPAYLENSGTPDCPSALSTHNCLLQSASPDPASWIFRMDGEDIAVQIDGSFIANSPLAVATMAASGLGICRCPFYTAQPFLEKDQLRILFEQQEASGSTLYAVYPPNRHLNTRIRELIDHLVQYFAKSAAQNARFGDD